VVTAAQSRGVHRDIAEEAEMDEHAVVDCQFVGMDLHRRRSVLVRMNRDGDRLETIRILNDRDRLAEVIARAGESPEVVLEATYGWYWAADALAEMGANVHLAHPLGVKGFSYRRVKNDERDAADLADLLRMHRLPEGWIAPPATRDLRELVRHRAKLVHLRTSLRQQIHALLAANGIAIPVSDLFGVAGNQLLDRVQLSPAARSRVVSLRGLLDALDVEIDAFAKLTTKRLRGVAGYKAVQTIPGVGPILGAVFLAEIGDVTRFPGPQQLASWAGLTPKHHESDTTVHRGRITKQGSVLVRWAAIEAAQCAGKNTRTGQRRDQIAQRRGRNIAVTAAARDLLTLVYYALRDGHVRCLQATTRLA
jgi:transposase